MRTTVLWSLVVSALVMGSGCPLGHDQYDTSRSCVENSQCPGSEICLAPDASVGDGGGLAQSTCQAEEGLTRCVFGDAGVSYYCSSSGASCYHQIRTCLEFDRDAGCPNGCEDDAGNQWDAGCTKWQPERFGCHEAKSGRYR
ncbi:MAG: hypothetical protein J7M25_07815 [Deltaproteobacteria bacterium]|nr:hypothetical protein [Deltaproteobacteria bacterium]